MTPAEVATAALLSAAAAGPVVETPALEAGDPVPEIVENAAPAPVIAVVIDPVQELIGLIRADVVDATANLWRTPHAAADALANALLQVLVPLLPRDVVVAELERREAAFGVQP